MTSLRIRRLWAGHGPETLDGVLLRLRNGRIDSLEPAGGPWDYPFAMPSFVDAHCHLLWLGFESVFADLSGIRSSGDLLRWLSRVPAPAAGEFVRGEKWDESLWSPGTLPALAELDSASGGAPVFLRRVCGHAALVNSAAMSVMGDHGLDPGGPGPLVVERPVMGFDTAFPPGRGTMAEALSSAVSRALASGVTAVTTMEPGRHLETYAAEGTGHLRVAVHVFREDLQDRLREASGSGIRGMKIFLDGAIGARTAAMDEPFDDGSTAREMLDDAELEELLLSCWRNGLVPAVHAIGGMALRQLDRVGGAARIRAGHGVPAAIRVEHAEDLASVWPGGWDRELHQFSMQPNFVSRWQKPGGMYDRRLGPSRARSLNPFGLVRRAGFDLGFGSDGMPFGPLCGLSGAVGHPDPSMRLSMCEALEAYTLGAARVSGFYDLAVPVGPGRPADIALLSCSPMEASPDEVVVEGVLASGELIRVPGDRTGEGAP